MPIHDWSRVPDELFHHFQQSWSIRLTDSLNSGVLPTGLAALVEQRVGIKEPDVLAIETYGVLDGSTAGSLDDLDGGIATMDAPLAKIVHRSTEEVYAARANRIVIRHHLGKIVAIIEIVSPGNKDRRGAVRDFVERTIDFIRSGVHVLVLDLFPPTPRDPHGLHKVIWDEIEDQEFELPKGQDRLLVSYQAGAEKVAYIEPLGVGDSMPDMPLFLTSRLHIKIPLESTYQATWDTLPEQLRTAVTTGKVIIRIVDEATSPE